MNRVEPPYADETLTGIRHRMEALFARFPARAIVVTRGAGGTIALSRDREFAIDVPITREGKSHPVGAGDAWSAGILFGLTPGWDIHSTMDLANPNGR